MLPEKYPEIHIYWREDPNKKKEYKEAFSYLLDGQKECVGEDTVGVVIVEGMKRVIPIALDDGYVMAQVGSSLSAATLITDSFFPVIFLEEDYYREMARNPVRRSNIYHEVGHIVLKHLKKKNEELKQNSIDRTWARKNNILFWQESEADLFACHYVGTDNMLIHLNGLKQDILNMARKGQLADNIVSEYLNETDMRIENIRATRKIVK